ncbi:hypothetical protein CLU85_2187 [Acidovorax sp. 69]|uniref:hypothetical protein n=1 Tax=Acidovorax sp. 69 TaxID=2035202 RepID=UPI000C242E28|nr:hypothetical protein [Acidovorax sp. 69]PJI97397.1 hypothetical protein CLU85_2187 [Acidovorax sp. 69]
MSSSPSTPQEFAEQALSSALSLHDARPFLEKALAYGVQHGVLGADKIAAINADAPKGIVQIARYFGSEFLRPELEKARDRMVNLISLYLLDTTEGDLHKAAVSLRDHSFLSRSKGGSDMLKRLIALPESSNFGMAGYADAETPLLAMWSLRSHADYRAELARRTQIAQAISAAQWLAEQYDLDTDELEAAGADAEAVIRTGLLMQVLAPKAMELGEWPHATAFEKRITEQRKKKLTVSAPLRLPGGVPPDLRDAMLAQCATVLADLPKLLDATAPLRTLLRATGAFRARYFLLDDPLAEVDDYHRSLDDLEQGGDEPPQPASKIWIKTTGGNDDEHSLLTLFLCLAAGAPKKTLLTEKTAASLVRKIRKAGLQPALASDFIRGHAPGAYHQDYLALWAGFVQEAEKTLTSDMDYQMHDALALLRRECHVAG